MGNPIMLPEPTARADAVGHYAALVADAWWPAGMMCPTVVRGLSAEEAPARSENVDGPVPEFRPAALKAFLEALPTSWQAA